MLALFVMSLTAVDPDLCPAPLSAEEMVIQSSIPGNPSLVERQAFGDFNGDGQSEDHAYFCRQDSRYQLRVVLDGREDDPFIIREFESLTNTGLQAHGADMFKNTCLEGSFRSCAGMISRIEVSYDSFSVYSEEAARTLFVYHIGFAEQFIAIPLAD
jgi:hypothetical protein